MNIYDKAHELAHALKESSEWKKLSESRQKVESDQKVYQMYVSLRSQQIELQQKQLSGVDLSKEELENFQKQYEISLMHEDIKTLIEAENRITIILEDIQKIIYQAISGEQH